MASGSTRKSTWRDLPAAALMLLPSLVIMSAFVLYPLAQAVWLGHTRCNAEGGNCRSNGWDQYVDVVRSNEFRHSVIVTLEFALITVPIGLALGVALAALADKYVRGIGVFRAIFSSTVATSVAVAGLMWWFLLEPRVGVLSNVGWIQDVFPVIKRPGLLHDTGTALPAVAASSIWAGLGFTFVLVTAGLQGIPRDLHEAAVLDGAGGMRRFWNITIPLLGPTLLFILIVLTAKAFQAYGEMDLLTSGGPDDTTTTLTYLTYGRESPINGQDGLKAAVAVLLFLMLLGLSAIQLRVAGRRVHYG